jgi:predicted transcriptional regulator
MRVRIEDGLETAVRRIAEQTNRSPHKVVTDLLKQHLMGQAQHQEKQNGITKHTD